MWRRGRPMDNPLKRSLGHPSQGGIFAAAAAADLFSRPAWSSVVLLFLQRWLDWSVLDFLEKKACEKVWQWTLHIMLFAVRPSHATSRLCAMISLLKLLLCRVVCGFLGLLVWSGPSNETQNQDEERRCTQPPGLCSFSPCINPPHLGCQNNIVIHHQVARLLCNPIALPPLLCPILPQLSVCPPP